MKAPIVILILVSFLVTSIVGPICPIACSAEGDYRLPAPGVMVHLSPPLDPPILKGIKVYPDNPFRFDFILDPGDKGLSPGGGDSTKQEATRLIKYFLASLTIPEKDLWVNLSPYEKDRIIPQSFGLTEMGRDLLAEDYMLKQITASLIYPEDVVGKKFWKRVYEEAQKRYGTTNVPVNTFNKVWIVPEKAVVYENVKAGTAYVVTSKLKVMLEQDYLSLEKHEGVQSGQAQTKDANQLGSQIVREIVIPELTREVNEDKNFAKLRQVYNSLILATWYKNKIKDSILEQVYADKNKVAGVNIDDPQEKQRIYEQYLRAFKKGVFNYIKEETGTLSHETIPRKYFSGGMLLNLEPSKAMIVQTKLPNSAVLESEEEKDLVVRADIDGILKNQSQHDFAMLNESAVKIARIVHRSDFEPVDLIDELGRSNSIIEAAYQELSGVGEGYSVEKHTAMVMERFKELMKHYGQSPLPAGIAPRVMWLALALHDLKKKEGEANQEEQHARTLAFIDRIDHQLPVTERELAIMRALINGDPIGALLRPGQNKTIDEVKDEVLAMAQKARLGAKEFLALLIIFYQSDAGAYSKAVGGVGNTDQAFDWEDDAHLNMKYDDSHQRWAFSPSALEKIAALESAVAASAVEEKVGPSLDDLYVQSNTGRAYATITTPQQIRAMDDNGFGDFMAQHLSGHFAIHIMHPELLLKVLEKGFFTARWITQQEEDLDATGLKFMGTEDKFFMSVDGPANKYYGLREGKVAFFAAVDLLIEHYAFDALPIDPEDKPNLDWGLKGVIDNPYDQGHRFNINDLGIVFVTKSVGESAQFKSEYANLAVKPRVIVLNDEDLKGGIERFMAAHHIAIKSKPKISGHLEINAEGLYVNMAPWSNAGAPVERIINAPQTAIQNARTAYNLAKVHDTKNTGIGWQRAKERIKEAWKLDPQDPFVQFVTIRFANRIDYNGRVRGKFGWDDEIFTDKTWDEIFEELIKPDSGLDPRYKGQLWQMKLEHSIGRKESELEQDKEGLAQAADFFNEDTHWIKSARQNISDLEFTIQKFHAALERADTEEEILQLLKSGPDHLDIWPWLYSKKLDLSNQQALKKLQGRVSSRLSTTEEIKSLAENVTRNLYSTEENYYTNGGYYKDLRASVSQKLSYLKNLTDEMFRDSWRDRDLNELKGSVKNGIEQIISQVTQELERPVIERALSLGFGSIDHEIAAADTDVNAAAQGDPLLTSTGRRYDYRRMMRQMNTVADQLDNITQAVVFGGQGEHLIRLKHQVKGSMERIISSQNRIPWRKRQIHYSFYLSSQQIKTANQRMQEMNRSDLAMHTNPVPGKLVLKVEAEDKAQLKGGIDLTPANMHIQTQNAGEGIKFHLNPAMLAQLQNAPGFVPVIINIQPLKSLSGFLGIQETAGNSQGVG